MIEFPYTLVPKRLQQFLERIPTDGQPTKVTVKTLEERGFRSSNDRSILRVIKSIGLTDDSGVPTQFWSHYRDRGKNRIILANLVRNTYNDLFHVYPDAQSRPEADLANFMSAKSKAPATTVRLMVATFQTLCALADFDNDREFLSDLPDISTDTYEAHQVNLKPSRSPSMLPSLQLILHLPETNDPDVYDAIFRSMAYHLLGKQNIASD